MSENDQPQDSAEDTTGGIPEPNLGESTPKDSELAAALESATPELTSAIDRVINIPPGTDPATEQAIRAILAKSAMAESTDVQTAEELTALQRKQQEAAGIVAEPTSALEQIAAASVEEQQRAYELLQADVARRAALPRASAAMGGNVGGRDTFAADLASITP